MLGSKYVASRLADGNKLFPPQIQIEAYGIKVRIPGFFKGKETFIPYEDIYSVSVDSKFIGFSTITFSSRGTWIAVHGFTKSQVNDIKRDIEKGKDGDYKREEERRRHNKYNSDDEDYDESDEDDDEEDDDDEDDDKMVASASNQHVSSSSSQSDDGLYDPKIEKLINYAIADGVITDKERQVLLEKAMSMGIDLDEFEMVLDAKLYEAKNKKN